MNAVHPLIAIATLVVVMCHPRGGSIATVGAVTLSTVGGLNNPTANQSNGLVIAAQVADKPLRINVPKDQAYNAEDLVEATLLHLGGKRHRLLAPPKFLPNSHGIVVKVAKGMVKWGWPNLTRSDIGYSASAGKWMPTHGANRRGMTSKYIECNQFCDIANQEGGATVGDEGPTLQLQFLLHSPNNMVPASSLTRDAWNEGVATSQVTLSPWACSFVPGTFSVKQGARNEGAPLLANLSHLTRPFVPCSERPAICGYLSPSAKPFLPSNTGSSTKPRGSVRDLALESYW